MKKVLISARSRRVASEFIERERAREQQPATQSQVAESANQVRELAHSRRRARRIDQDLTSAYVTV